MSVQLTKQNTAPGKILFFVLLLLSIAGPHRAASLPSGSRNFPALTQSSIRDTLSAPANDTLQSETDSLQNKDDALYRYLQRKSSRFKWLQSLVNSMFVNTGSRSVNNANFHNADAKFYPYSGKIIRKIYFRSVNLLAPSIRDSTLVPRSGLAFWIDRTHVNTRDGVIRKNMFVAEGDSLNPELLADNERILSELPYISDAEIHVAPVEGDSNFVDLLVLIQDKVSLGATGSIKSVKRSSLSVFDRNFIGTGNEVRLGFIFNQDFSPQFGFEGRYLMNNLWGKFVNGTINYYEADQRQNIQLKLSKGFITNYTRYGGGVDLRYYVDRMEKSVQDSIFDIKYSENLQDFWVGRSFILGNPKDRRNLVFTARLQRHDFLLRPFTNPDSNYFFHDRIFLLGGLNLIKVNYLKTRMLLHFTIPEFVPYGYLLQVLFGREYAEYFTRFYWGVGAAGAKYWSNFGYSQLVLRIGSFIRDNQLYEGIFSLTGNYFSNLIHVWGHRYRQLLRLVYTTGFKRNPFDKIYLDKDIPGISHGLVSGRQKIVLQSESVLFTPWYFYGFRLAIYGSLGMGFIYNNTRIPTWQYPIYKLELGFRISNDHLVFKNIQFSMSYYSTSPYDSFWKFNFTTREPQLFKAVQISAPAIYRYR